MAGLGWIGSTNGCGALCRASSSRLGALVITFALVAHIPPRPVFAQAGTLDPTFGADGRVTTDFFGSREQARDVVVQRDGRIIAAGSADNPARGTRSDFALARYNVDGSLDTSFSGDGRVATDFFGSFDGIEAVALQPDGKIVAAGGAFTPGGAAQFALARYNADGTPDFTFGSSGKVTLGGVGFARGLAVQADGKLVVGADGPVLARFSTFGSLDPAFGASGLVTPDFRVADVAVSPDGKIVAAGSDVVIIGPDPEDPEGSIGREVVAVGRFNADGSPDATFGEGGKVLTELHEVASRAAAVLIQTDGKIVAVGTANNMFAVARYGPDGSLDATFGNGGFVTTSLAGDNDRAFAGALQADGKIVAAGWATGSSTSNDFGLVRYNTDGSLDTTFGNSGVVITDFGNNMIDIANGVAIAPGGKIVAAGWTNLGDFPTDTFALARYLGAPSPQDIIQKLLDDVTELVASDALNQGQGDALAAILSQAANRLEEGNAEAAANEVRGFINQVNALVRAGTLSSSQSQALIDQAEAILNQIAQ